MTADGVHVVEGAGWLEVHPEEVVLIRSGDPERRPLAAVRLSDRLWVAIGDRPPAHWPEARRLPEEAPAAARKRGWLPGAAVVLGDGGWPPEPPPDVDSER